MLECVYFENCLIPTNLECAECGSLLLECQIWYKAQLYKSSIIFENIIWKTHYLTQCYKSSFWCFCCSLFLRGSELLSFICDKLSIKQPMRWLIMMQRNQSQNYMQSLRCKVSVSGIKLLISISNWIQKLFPAMGGGRKFLIWWYNHLQYMRVGSKVTKGESYYELLLRN